MNPEDTHGELRAEIIRCLSIVQTYSPNEQGEAVIELEANHIEALLTTKIEAAERAVEGILLERIKVIGDGEFTLLGTPAELIAELTAPTDAPKERT